MKFALILDLEVKNIISADQAFADLIAINWDYVIQSDSANIYDIYDPVTETFTYPTPAEPPAMVWPVIRIIKKEKWYDRWTDDDLGKLLAVANTNEGMAGWMDWIRSQSALDLDSTRITSKLQQGVDGGHITQSAMDILLADVTEEEMK